MADRRNTYIYGNTVRQAEVMPRPRRRQEEMQPVKKPVSKRVRQNRRKAEQMSASYVMFLAAAAIITLLVCVQYLNLKANISNRSSSITKMQQELSSLKEDNNTLYNNIEASVNMEDIRTKAQGLGMVYANSDQVVEYKSPTSDFVTQYEDIPEDGVLATDKAVNE